MGCQIKAWFAGLPAAVCGWMLEAIKRLGGDPPVRKGAGYNEAYTAAAGFLYVFQSRVFQDSAFFRKLSASLIRMYRNDIPFNLTCWFTPIPI